MTQTKKKLKKKGKKKASNKNRNILVASILIAACFAIGFYIYKVKTFQPSTFDQEKFTVKGVDLSHHNPIVDWAAAHNQDIQFVYLKATGGVAHLDRNYMYNYDAAKKNTLRVGSYHFYLFGASGVEQARHFINTAVVKSGDLLPAIDVEHSSDNPYSRDTAYVKQVINELKVLENELYMHYGVRPMIYTNRDCYKLYIAGNFPDNYIWMCDLKKEPDDIANWVIWQFSHKGELVGVEGDIDLNYFRYSHQELSKILVP